MKSWNPGSCHCGAVAFRVRSDFTEVLECNCSLCDRRGFLHLIVPREDFNILRGEENLTLYQFGTRTARHLFCRTCGVTAFYVPRSHPDGYSVNLRCVEGVDRARVKIVPFDGRDWEKARAALD